MYGETVQRRRQVNQQQGDPDRDAIYNIYEEFTQFHLKWQENIWWDHLAKVYFRDIIS